MPRRDIKTGKFLKGSPKLLNHNFEIPTVWIPRPPLVPKRFTVADAYWGGFLWADGCIKQKDGQLQVCLSIKDRQQLVYLAKYISDEMRVCDYSDRCYIQITHPELQYNLGQLNIVPQKTKLILVIPDIIKDNPHLHSHYVRGLIDGDGWISLTKDRSYDKLTIGLCAYRKKTLTNILALIPLEIQKFCHILKKKNQHLYELRITRKKVSQQFIVWLYQDSIHTTRLARKYNTSQKILKLDTRLAHKS